MTEPIVKLTKKQKKAIKKQQKRQAEKRRLHALLIEYRLAARREAYADIHESNISALGDVENEREIAQRTVDSSNEALDGFAAAHPNIRPLEVVHRQIIGD